LVSQVDLHGELGVVTKQISIGGKLLVTEPLTILRPISDEGASNDTNATRKCRNDSCQHGGSDRHVASLQVGF
jgi:hypothetical protein